MDLNQTDYCDYSGSIEPLQNDTKPSTDNNELADQITLLAAYINAATYRFLKFVSEFDRRKGWSGAGVRSCAHWLNYKCGIDDCAARERVRIARCLDKLPLINKAFESGEVSYSKVRAMTRVATDDNEDFLLNIAHYSTASQVEILVRKYQKVEKNQNQPLERQEQCYQSRSFKSYQDIDGMWVIHAKLPQVEGGLVVKAIEEMVRQQDKPFPEIFCANKDDSAECGRARSLIPVGGIPTLARLVNHQIANIGQDGSNP